MLPLLKFMSDLKGHYVREMINHGERFINEIGGPEGIRTPDLIENLPSITGRKECNGPLPYSGQ